MAFRLRTSLILILAVGLLGTSSAQGLDTTDYFPLHVGDRWWTIGLGGYYWGIKTSQVTGTVSIRDTNYFVIDSVSLYRRDSVGNVHTRINGIDQLFYKLTAKRGEKWNINFGGHDYEMSLLSDSVDRWTATGLFRRSKIFRYLPAGTLYDTDVFFTLSPGIGLSAYDTNPITDEHWDLRRAVINGTVVSSPFHVMNGTLPWSSERDVDPATVITIRFDSPTDTNLVVNSIKVFSKKIGLVGGKVHFLPDNLQLYVFYPYQNFLTSDTITVRLSGDIKDTFGEGLDGNRNWMYEGSPADDYSWLFYTWIVTDVEDPVSEKVPVSFSLSQNYPNPFNPSTTIRYTVGEVRGGQQVFVKLVVYNVLGQEVKTLVAEPQQPGTYHVTWDGTDNSGKRAPSGVYIYRLIAGSYVSAKTMVLLK